MSVMPWFERASHSIEHGVMKHGLRCTQCQRVVARLVAKSTRCMLLIIEISLSFGPQAQVSLIFFG